MLLVAMESGTRTTVATIAALIGFAANSLLCRAALGPRSIDAWSFTCVRLCAGALTLFLLARLASASRGERAGGSWASALALFGYAAAFSLAYLRVDTGVGALVLFASVQATMIGWSVKSGANPSRAEWAGLAIAFAGLAWLALPGASAPDPIGLCLMAVAGVAWGAYSLRGRASRAPLAATAQNFLRSAPMALAALGLALVFSTPHGSAALQESAALHASASPHASARGITLALASGAIASGLGYSLWYLALPGLSATRAAIVQLVVPALAAAAGVVLLSERLTTRLVAAGVMILGGVGIAVSMRRTREKAPVRAGTDGARRS